VKKLIVRTLTFSECDGHEPILTGQVGAVNNEDLGQRRVTCIDISGHQRYQSSSTGSQKLFEGKSSTRLSASFCRAISLLATLLAMPL